MFLKFETFPLSLSLIDAGDPLRLYLINGAVAVGIATALRHTLSACHLGLPTKPPRGLTPSGRWAQFIYDAVIIKALRSHIR
jgi:hypothetical protein